MLFSLLELQPKIDRNGPDAIQPIRCKECGNWVKATALGKHMWDHVWDMLILPRTDDINWCNHCNRMFATDRELRDHYMVVNRFGKFFCMICLKDFQTDEERMHHMRCNHIRQSM